MRLPRIEAVRYRVDGWPDVEGAKQPERLRGSYVVNQEVGDAGAKGFSSNFGPVEWLQTVFLWRLVASNKSGIWI
jgi:hypothetical protein